MYLISYDASSDKLRRKLSKILEGFGRRVQFSVFECDITKVQFKTCCAQLVKAMDGEKMVSVRCYFINKNCMDERIVLGDPTYEPGREYHSETDVYVV